jgi:Helix-turn-helix domain
MRNLPASDPFGASDETATVPAIDPPNQSLGRSRRLELIPDIVWTRPDMREALATRNIAAVYKLLQRHGVAQRVIAARTGQAQSEVSEILSGRRVHAYEVLTRIADGLGVPRGWMGLAYDDNAGQP